MRALCGGCTISRRVPSVSSKSRSVLRMSWSTASSSERTKRATPVLVRAKCFAHDALGRDQTRSTQLEQLRDVGNILQIHDRGVHCILLGARKRTVGKDCELGP